MLRILVADDNPLSLRFFADALARPDWVCEAVATGAAAIARCESERFDLLLLDARMPGSSGVETLSRIRNGDGDSRNAVALATTAANDAGAIAELLRAGFAEVLAKPITIAALHAAVDRHVVRHIPATAPAPCGVERLDDASALRASAGDPAIVAALRRLLAAELAKLGEEFSGLSARRDHDALEERLHRLDASAGFCGVTALTQAITTLRGAASMADAWPSAAIAEFLQVCDALRAKLSR